MRSRIQFIKRKWMEIAERKSISIDDLAKENLVIKTNESKIPYRLLYTEKKRINNNGCGLCKSIENPDNLILHNLFRPYIISMNDSPVSLGHVVIVHEKHASRKFRQDDIECMLKIVRKTGYRVIRDMKDVGASITDHEHFQGFFNKFPVEYARRKPISESVSTMPDYPAANIVFSCKNDSDIKKAVGLIDRLEERLEIPYNLIVASNDVYIFPRKKEYCDLEDFGKVCSLEAGGIFLFKDYGKDDEFRSSRNIRGKLKGILRETIKTRQEIDLLNLFEER